MQLARRETWHCQSGTIGIALDPPWNPSTRLFVLWGFGGNTPDEQRETNDHGSRELAIDFDVRPEQEFWQAWPGENSCNWRAKLTHDS
jgi:hypothetical protein